MKKYLALAGIISFFTIMQSVFAQTASPSGSAGTPTPTPLQKIEELKERLATKVAEMRQSQKKAIFGKVKSVSVTSFVLEAASKDIKIELADNIKVAQIIRGQRTALTVDDVSKGDSVTVFGDYDATVNLLKAKVIFIQSTLPLRVIGTVTAIDKNEYTLTVGSPDGTSYVVDIETDTKTVSWSADKGITKSGFSKISIGDSVQVVALPEPKQTARVSGRRILDLGNLLNPTPTPTRTPSPEASPSATPKATKPSPTP